MNRAPICVAIASALVSQLGCGDRPAALGPPLGLVAPPAPATTAVPTATPTPSGVCANGNMPVARFDIKVHTVRDKNGELREFRSSRGPFYVGERLRFDSQGKDRFGRRTDGCTGAGPRWSWRPEMLVDWHGEQGWMPSAKILAPGALSVSAQFEDGVLDFPLEIELRDPPSF